MSTLPEYGASNTQLAYFKGKHRIVLPLDDRNDTATVTVLIAARMDKFKSVEIRLIAL